MAETTGIGWTDATWSCVTGCERISPGCARCYAEKLTATRLAHQPKYKGLAVLTEAGEPHWTGDIRLHEDLLATPLSWRKPKMIFVNSMSDTFHEDVPDEFIVKMLAVMALTPHHTYQILTKRSERMHRVVAATNAAEMVDHVAFHISHELMMGGSYDAVPEEWPLPNVWLGVSVEDNKRKDRIDDLRRAPAAIRFISFEPLLEDLGELNLEGIKWAIIGCESEGPRIGRLGTGDESEWWQRARNIVRQCELAGVAVFVKQGPSDGRVAHNVNSFPTDMRTQAFPKVA